LVSYYRILCWSGSNTKLSDCKRSH
jgi:hypothetical protein